MEQEKHYIYHITHIDNLRDIIYRQKLLSKNMISNSYKDIAYRSVQQKRSNKNIPIYPHGCLHDYVPFYFGMRSPMLYAIYKDSVEDYAEGQEQIIYLVSTVEWCHANQLNFIFTDGHAVMEFTSFYNELEDLKKVDFKAAKARTWFDDPKHPDRKRRKQSEFLVKMEYPWQGILGIVTINEAVEDRITTIYNELRPFNQPQIVVKPEWYY